MTTKMFLKRYLGYGCFGQLVLLVGLAMIAAIFFNGKSEDWVASLLMSIFCLWLVGGVGVWVYLTLTAPKREARSRQRLEQNEAAAQAKKDWDTEKKEWDNTHCPYCKARLDNGVARCPHCGASKK